MSKDSTGWKQYSLTAAEISSSQVYPSPDGRSVIPPEKLEKEYQKGTLRPPNPDEEKEVDGDMDEKVISPVHSTHGEGGQSHQRHMELLRSEGTRANFKESTGEIFQRLPGFVRTSEGSQERK